MSIMIKHLKMVVLGIVLTVSFAGVAAAASDDDDDDDDVDDTPSKLSGAIAAYVVPHAINDIKVPGSSTGLPGDVRDQVSGHIQGYHIELGTQSFFGYAHYESSYGMSAKVKSLPVPLPAPTSQQVTDNTELRLGLGYRYFVDPDLDFTLTADHFKDKQTLSPGLAGPKFNDQGYGSHVGTDYVVYKIAGKAPIILSADVGKYWLDKSDALEWHGIVKVGIAPHVGAFVGYRWFKRERDNLPELGQVGDTEKLHGFNVGLVVLF